MSRFDTFAFLRALRDSRTLSRNAKDAGWALSTHGEYAYPGNELLAAEASCSVSSVQRGLKELTAAGAITLVKSGQGSNSKHASVYRLHYPFQPVTLTGSTGHTDLTNTNEIPKTIEDSTGHTDRLKVAEPKVTSGVSEAHPSSEAVEVADVLDSLDSSSEAVEVADEPQGPELSSEAGQTDHTPIGHSDPLKDSAQRCPNGCGTRIPADWSEQQIYGHFAACRLSSPELRRSAREMLQRAAVQKPQGMSQRNARVVENAAKWECTECGGQFSYLGKPGQMCHRCKQQVEG